MKKLFFFLFCLLNCFYSFSQEKTFELFPAGLNYIPPKANLYEAKMGLIYIPENNSMKIDIGVNVDIINYQISDTERLTAGIEFFAYAFSRSYNEFRLQIDAIDGFFGGNFSYSKKIDDKKISGRFRIIHNSAHLVDGHWDFHNNKWIDNYKPIPYARDFAEISLAYNYNLGLASLTNYAAFDYAFLVRPPDVKKFNFNTGIDAGFTGLSGNLLGKSFQPFIAYNFLLSGSDNFTGSSNFMAGIKFGGWNERGLLIFISYYKGLDVFHAYYKRRVERFGLGFSVDLL